MNSIWVALIGMVWLFLAYHLYGRFIERRLTRTDPNRRTPAHTRFDGVDYQPTRPMILFGHHFASIAGAGPIVGPVVAAMAFGWVAGAIWILVGVVFIGAVHDYMALTVSIHHGGRSISDTSRDLVGRRSWLFFQVFVWIALVLVIAVFIDVAVRSFVANPQIVFPAFALLPIAVIFGLVNYRWKLPLVLSTLVCLGFFTLSIVAGAFLPITLPGGPETVFRLWFFILALYGWIASVLPVWILLQPRDYIANWVLMIGISLGTLGLFIGGHPITAPAFTGMVSADHGPIFPMLFVLTAWLVGQGRSSVYTLVPALFMLATSVSAFGWQAWRHLFRPDGSLLLGVFCLVLLSMALVVSVDALRAARRSAFRCAGGAGQVRPRPAKTG